jgi:hypothetical protein
VQARTRSKNPMNLKQIAANKGAFGIVGQVAMVAGACSGLSRACAISLRLSRAPYAVIPA